MRSPKNSVKNIILYSIGAILTLSAIVFFINAFFIQDRVSNGVYRSSPADYGGQIDKVESVYDIEFDLASNKIDSIASYVPIYDSDFYANAGKIASAFGFSGAGAETGDGLEYSDADGDLTIYADLNHIYYEKKSGGAPADGEAASPETAQLCAEEFIKSKKLALDYADTRAEADNAGYQITFFTKLNDLVNYAYPVVAQTDANGDVITLDYYMPGYERLGTAAALTMTDAFYLLPTDGLDDKSIDITSCELVYFYEDSIVQPGYLFRGDIIGADSGDFEYIVKASKYY